MKKIVIASLGRAHLLDCARELKKQGYDVLYFCSTHPNNFEKYDFPVGGHSLIYYVAPLYFLVRLLPSNFTRRLYSFTLDLLVCIFMPKCDVFIAQSPNYQFAIKYAKWRYKAITILDRGSSHVRIMNDFMLLFGGRQHTNRYLKRDEHEYHTVDYITLASDFVYKGFIDKGFSINKLFVNPYGVSLYNFHPTLCSCEYDAILVGQWSKRKGHELVVNTFKDTDYKILHVGSITDYPFPDYSNFKHIDSVPENELINYYSKSRIFLFPSYEDGFGLVLLQAAACGLPIVCSSNSGGPTLKRMLTRKGYIYEMKELSKEELMAGFKIMYNIYEVNQLRNYAEEDIDKFSWKAYGDRYAKFLNAIGI